MRPKECGEVTLVCATDLEPNLDEGHVGLGQQAFRILHAARDDILVGSQPRGVLEQSCKMSRARLCHSGERGQG